MSEALALVTLVVRDYDEAIAYFTTALGFRVVADTELGPEKRWVVVAPESPATAGLLLARASSPEQDRVVGNQTGGRVGFFLNTGNFASAYERMRAHKVRFLEEPRRERYGRVAVFADLYGNRWDLVEGSGLEGMSSDTPPRRT